MPLPTDHAIDQHYRVVSSLACRGKRAGGGRARKQPLPRLSGDHVSVEVGQKADPASRGTLASRCHRGRSSSGRSDQINTILAAGRADLVALGRPHLIDPSFTHEGRGLVPRRSIFCPPPYLPGKEQIFRNSVRDRQDFDDLKIKAKPKTRAELKAEATKPLAAE